MDVYGKYQRVCIQPTTNTRVWKVISDLVPAPKTVMRTQVLYGTYRYVVPMRPVSYDIHRTTQRASVLF